MDLWLFAALIAFLSLDTTAVGQFMVSRPIVVGSLVGGLVGDLGLGLSAGALIELVWIGQLPVGNHLPLDATLLTGLTVALTAWLGQRSGGAIPYEALFTFTLAAGIPLAILSSEAEKLLRKFHQYWVHRAQRLMEEKRFFLADSLNIVALVEQFLKSFVMAAAGFWLLSTLTPWFLHLPVKVLHGFTYAHWFLLALGCATAIDLLVERRALPYLVFPALAAATLVYFLSADALYLALIALLSGFAICFREYRAASRTMTDEPRPEVPPIAIPRWVLAWSFIRTFFLQTLWNFERGINYGFAYTLAPILRHLFPPEERSRALVRHLDYFNTQPYFASFIVGATARMEAERAQMPDDQQKLKEEEISALKMGMMSPAASLGDQLFWATLRPYCGLMAVLLVFTGAFQDRGLAFVIPALFLLVYNTAHLWVRGVGFLQGFQQGDQIIHTLKRQGYKEAVQYLRLAAAVLLGVLIVCINYLETRKGLPLFTLKMVFFSGLLGLYAYFLHKRVTVTLLFYSVVLFALILAYWPDLSAPPPNLEDLL